MFNTSQVILRNQSLFQGQSTFVLNPPSDDLLRQEPLCGAVLTWDYSVYRALNARQVAGIEFAPLPSQQAVMPQVLIFMPKSQAEFDLLWQIACARVEMSGHVFLVGEKREGINNAAKRLQDQGVQLVKLDSARHCQLWRAVAPATSELPDFEAYYQVHEVTVPDGVLQIRSLPGVFGVGRLDEGTRLLLEHLGNIPTGRLLDFGCGAGVIGAYLNLAQPTAEVHLVDIHALALESARRTLRENNLVGKVYASDGLSEVQGCFRAIYTNPPFHAGVKTDYRATEQMIREARERLEPGGELRLVANAFLHYPDLIEAVFGNCEILAQTSKFKVYRAVRAR